MKSLPAETAEAGNASLANSTGESSTAVAAGELAAAGGLLGGLAATSCCIVPLVLFSLGVSGVWIDKLTALAPYQPIIVAATLAVLGYGFFQVYRRPAAVRGAACGADAACARPVPRRLVKGALWVSTVLVAAAAGFPYAAPLLLGTGS